MWRVGFCLFLLSCTKPNPNNCESGVCSDPALPYCDVSGAISGTPKTCVAVSCTANAFEACDGNSAVVCNASGDNYSSQQCTNGCDPTIGCRVCAAGETVCANGEVQTCDATGAVTSSTKCPLGCFEDQPRCRDIDPSNGLAQYMDMATAGPDLVMSGGQLNVPSGKVGTLSGGPANVAVFTVAATSGGAPMAVIPLHSLMLSGSVQLVSDTGDDAAPAVVFVVAGKVEINGTLRLAPGADDTTDYPPPGAISAGDCVGAPPKAQLDQDAYFAGGGGGGGATVGGAGGAQYFPASAGGVAFVHPDLQPLRGGCAGGTGNGGYRGLGGGALQITSRTEIYVGANAIIDANGLSGISDPGDGTPFTQLYPTGGGAGGGVLMEAPVVSLDSGSLIVANGGAGASGDGHVGTSPSGRTPAHGGVCAEPAALCTNGGDGGSVDGPGRTAASITYTTQKELYTGGGGGAVGIIRINTATATFVQASDVYLSPMPSTGSIKTR